MNGFLGFIAACPPTTTVLRMLEAIHPRAETEESRRSNGDHPIVSPDRVGVARS